MEYAGTYNIIGPPGTGKTTRLGKSVARIIEGGQRVLLTSLTRAAAAEIVGRQLPVERECVGTLHSHAYRALGCPEVAEGCLAEWNEACPEFALHAEGAVDVDDPYGDRPSGWTALGAELSQEYGLLRARCTPRERWPMRVVEFAREWEGWKAETQRLDFTDLIERAAENCDPPTRPDVLLVDEAQDHSALEFNLIRRWASRCQALLVVGDPWQALYTWRGADPAIFDDASAPDTHRDVLGQSWRVPRAVHAEAIRWVKQLSTWRPIEYRPRDEEGSVAYSPASWNCPDLILEQAMRRIDDGQSVMIAAACSYQLAGVLNYLRREGVPFSNPWRSKRGDWNPIRSSAGKTISTGDRILAFLRPLTELPPDLPDPTSFSFGAAAPAPTWTARDVHLWAELLNTKGLMQRGAKKRFEEMAAADSAVSFTPVDDEFLHTWFEPESAAFLGNVMSAQVSTAEALHWLEVRLMASRRPTAQFALKVASRRGPAALASLPQLYVGTIHSFKGAEADCVYVFPDLSPAGMIGYCGGGEERDSIIRMFYVSMTRARRELVLCSPGSGRAVQWT